LSSRDANRRTPLHYAANNGHQHICGMIAAFCKTQPHVHSHPQLPVSNAGKNSRTSFLINDGSASPKKHKHHHNSQPKSLCHNFRHIINARDKFGCTAISIASFNGDALVVSRLLDDQADHLVFHLSFFSFFLLCS